MPLTVQSSKRLAISSPARTKYGAGRWLSHPTCFLKASSISGSAMASRPAYQLRRPSQPTEICEKTNEPIGISGCIAPEVPIRNMFSRFFTGQASRVAKSILARASSSFITMSMLSVPIPVDRTVTLVPAYLPVTETNSLEACRNSLSCRYSATMSTRPGSPTRITLSASSSGLRCKWNTDPSSFIISSDSAILIIRIFKSGFQI